SLLSLHDALPICGHLATAAGYVGEPGGAEASEKTAEFSAEQVRSEIHQHVSVIDFADVGDVREDLAADGDALLGDPHAVFCRKCKLDRGVPGGFAGFPT